MQDPKNRQRVYDEFKTALSRDRSENYISSISDLGLVEMTRERIRASFMHTFSDPCPICHGVGRVLSQESLAIKIERWFKRASANKSGSNFQLITNPQVSDLLMAGRPSRLRNIERQFRLKISLIVDTSIRPEEFKIIDMDSGREVTESFRA